MSGQPCPTHGGAPTPEPTSDPGETPQWSQPLGKRIGSGGFAAVWEIDDTAVLKVAHADHDLARARLLREAEALAAIGAPAVPRHLDHGVLADGRAWIAMERITGEPLADVIATGARADAVISLGVAIADALAQIHAAGFVHRDIKPDNLVRRHDDTIAILDLGLARKIPSDPDDPTRAGVQVGSLEYIPPEQIADSAAVDARADIYAVGCVLYELAAGRPPFVGDAAALERAHVALRPPPLGALATVPTAFEALVHDCLAKDPARRPASAGELRARLLDTRHDVSIARSGYQQVIGEGAQPVVLLWIELPRVDRALLALVQARRVTVISQRGRRVLGGIVGAEVADPAAAAISAARDLAAAGARVALHLDALRVVATSGAYTIAGATESWVPQDAWSGVVLSRALAAVTQTPTRASPLGGHWVELAEPAQGRPGSASSFGAGASTALFGRDALIADLAADCAAAVGKHGPALALVIGDAGVGKTSLAAAVVERVLALGVRVHAAAIPQPGAGRTAASALAELIGTPRGPVVRAVGDALRAAAREQPTAVILDDLHYADHELLAALEYATLGGESLPLWVLGLASPRFDARRPGFGGRAERHRRDVLAPLDEDAAVAMIAELLKPAEYPPLRALRHLAALARGNPMHLTTLAREIHDRGAIRTRATGEHFLDTSALDALPTIALGPWLAARELAGLGVELVALARLCAVLGDEIGRDELVTIVDAVEKSGGATTTIDVDVGIRELVAANLLVASGSGWAFRQTLLEQGIYETTNPDERLALHRAALAHWCDGGNAPEIAERVARHAEAAGEARLAAQAFARIAEHAHRDHRALDADQAWQGALRNLDARDAERGRALLGRARARYRLQRVRDALADLDEARAIALELADRALEIEILLEQATALDWGDDFAASSAVAEQAGEKLAATPVSELEVQLALARGRSLFRAERFAEAVPTLRSVIAAAAGRGETEIVAGVLLAPALVEIGELDAAAQAFAETIALCEARGDRFHLGACYANRAWLWSKRGEVDRTAQDLRVVIQVAREIGQATLERIGTYNLAEDRLWQGALDEALHLAQRSVAIQRGHGEGTERWDQLLVARVLAAFGDRGGELAALLDVLESGELEAGDRAMVRVLRCAAADRQAGDWERALDDGDAILPLDRRLELAHLAIQRGMLSHARRAEVRELATRHPIWLRRLDEL